jgi:hypothetical protein
MSEEQIIPAADDPNPGTEDGVGERVQHGLGSEGVQRMDGEFGDLDEDASALADDEGDAPA